jgi:hypothetical protein
MSPQPMPPAKLREAIAEAMYPISAYDLAHACDALGMPPGPPGDEPMASKRRYVRNRLATLGSAELAEMARSVATEYGDSELATLIGPTGLRGVDGELKNLISLRMGTSRGSSCATRSTT